MLSEVILNRIAHAAYSAVRAWDMDNGADELPVWAEADDEIKTVVFARINATLSDPRAGDATYHNKWLENVKKEGWTGGKPFDEKRKVDPMAFAFHMLPPEAQARERLFRAVILSLSRV